MSQFLQNTLELWKSALPLPNEHNHKHNRGRLLIAGSRHMPGAAILASRGARRMGCGLVYMAVPNEVAAVYMSDYPGNIILRAEDAGAFRSAINSIDADALVVGPGMRKTDITRDMVQRALLSAMPTVVDAGGLSVYAKKVERLQKAIFGPVVLTPHLGEYENLFGKDERSMAEKAAFAAQYFKAVVVLKGAQTYIAAPDGRIAETEKASAWLATGGTGDVLSGQIGALLAQKVDPFLASCAAVWFHRKAAEKIGAGLIAEDIPNHLPSVWNDVIG